VAISKKTRWVVCDQIVGESMKIISGAQTGADQAGLDAAISLGLDSVWWLAAQGEKIRRRYCTC